jgi:hypothetical protein
MSIDYLTCSDDMHPDQLVVPAAPMTRPGSVTAAGKGRKDRGFYDWAYIRIDGPSPGVHSLLIRNLAGEPAFYLCWTPGAVPLLALVAAADDTERQPKQATTNRR